MTVLVKREGEGICFLFEGFHRVAVRFLRFSTNAETPDLSRGLAE